MEKISTVVFVFSVISDVFAVPTLYGNPNVTTLATLYSNYTNAAIVSNVVECAWTISYKGYNETTRFYGQFTRNGTSCRSNQVIGQTFLYCDETFVNSSNRIKTELTILTPVPAGRFVAAVICLNTVNLSKITFVQNCSDNFSTSNITIVPNSQTYRGNANFSCSNGGMLYNFTGKNQLKKNAITECLEDATWKGQNNLHCWNVPSSINISGEFTVKAGNKIMLNCTYVSVEPFGNLSRYFIGQNNFPFVKDKPFEIMANVSNNGENVFCQAVTPYTNILTDTGKSSIRQLNILYEPHQTDADVTECRWRINETGSCEVRFISNPSASYVSLSLNDKIINVSDKTYYSLYGIGHTEQTFNYTKKNVTMQDIGMYSLVLRSSEFPDTHIDFRIRATGSESSSGLNIIALIVGVAAGALFVLLLLIVVIVCKKKCRSKQPDSSENEQRANPLYDTSQPSDNYSKVDSKTKKTKEVKDREQKANPLYSPSTSHQVEEAYAEVDKKKTLKKETKDKEEKANPLYSPSTDDQVKQVEEAYAEIDKKKTAKKGNSLAPQETSLYSEVAASP